MDFYPRSPCGERRSSKTHDRHKTIISIHALLAESDRPIEVPQYHILISIHALLAESDICVSWMARSHLLFLSTLSLRRATTNSRPTFFWQVISIHALLAESDHCDTLSALAPKEFLSTLSLRRATRLPTALRTPHQRFLSTLSLRRATRVRGENRRFYPFLSTLSLRRATRPVAPPRKENGHFYPRSPCGERPGHGDSRIKHDVISIHALLAESDGRRLPFRPRSRRFLSTLSLRRATSKRLI